MADVKQIWLLFALCLVLGFNPSVYCQLVGSQFTQQQLQQIQQLPLACQCPPAWTRQLQPYESLLSSVLRIPNNALCMYIAGQKLMSSCSPTGANTVCGNSRQTDFCCCPVSTSLGLLGHCNKSYRAGSNVCIPTQINKWQADLFEAFGQITYGK